MNPFEAEIHELHKFFQYWFTGTVPESDAVFERCTSVLSDDFTLITPNGVMIVYPALVELLKASYNTRDQFKIWIKNIQVHQEHPNGSIVTYQEWQKNEGATRVRISTAIFQQQEGTPNGIVWRHVHETWLS
jgi:hypothetical protein